MLTEGNIYDAEQGVAQFVITVTQCNVTYSFRNSAERQYMDQRLFWSQIPSGVQQEVILHLHLQ